MYSKTLVTGWGDMDFNAHMGAAAYLVKCFDVRMMYFAENGYRWENSPVSGWDRSA